MEITSEEQNKVKEWKELRIVSGPLGQCQMQEHLHYRGPRGIREKERIWENFWRDYSWKFPQHGKGNCQPSPRGAKSPVQNKPKEKHAKTHTNQTYND